jgi:hypothetical protein
MSRQVGAVKNFLESSGMNQEGFKVQADPSLVKREIENSGVLHK